jgi:hypothetical protein
LHFTDPRPIWMMLKALSVLTFTFACVGTALAQSNPAFDASLEPQIQGPDYNARVPLSANTAQARDAALIEALAQVFERASGGGQMPPSYRSRAKDWVLNFNLDRDTEGLGLRASFDPRSIDDAVTNAGFPLWGTQSFGADLVDVQLGNVSSPERYAQVMSRLGNDRRIERIDVQSLNGTELTLRLMAEGGRQTVLELLSNSGLASSGGGFGQTLRLDLR